jgi:hypothetical protein
MVFRQAKARERRPGEIRVKAFVNHPEREKPGESPEGGSANPMRRVQGLSAGAKPRNRGLPGRPEATRIGRNGK